MTGRPRPPSVFAVLYSFRRCPYAIRARLALKYAGIDVELREVVLRAKPAALVALSPKATVPVLELPDGTVLDESMDIMRWALSVTDPQHWFCPDESAEVAALVALNDGPFKQLLDRYKYAPQQPGRIAAEARDEAVRLMLLPMAERLASHRFLLRDTVSLADIAIVPFVRQFAAVDPRVLACPPLAPVGSWLRALVGAELFESVMQKRRPWAPGDSATWL